MKPTELYEIIEVFETVSARISCLCGAREVKKDVAAVKSTAHRPTTDAIDIVWRDLGIGFKDLPGQRFVTLGRT